MLQSQIWSPCSTVSKNDQLNNCMMLQSFGQALQVSSMFNYLAWLIEMYGTEPDKKALL